MSKILKILGKRGRITIPFELRVKYGYSCNDVVSFEDAGNFITVKREKLYTDCQAAKSEALKKPLDEASLLDFLDGLTPEEQGTALIHLSKRYAESRVKKNA